MADELPVLIAKGAYQSGAGRALHKYVCGLTQMERDLACAGLATVGFRSNFMAHGKHGTVWRVCKVGPRRRLYPRVPGPELVARLEKAAMKEELPDHG